MQSDEKVLQEESLQTKKELQAEVRKFEEESKKSQAELINQKKEIALQNQKLNEKMWCDLEKSKGDLTQQVKVLYEKKIESTKDSMKNISDQMENLRNLIQNSNRITKITVSGPISDQDMEIMRNGIALRGPLWFLLVCSLFDEFYKYGKCNHQFP